MGVLGARAACSRGRHRGCVLTPRVVELRILGTRRARLASEIMKLLGRMSLPIPPAAQALLVLLAILGTVAAAPANAGPRVVAAVEFARVGEQRLMLDLHLPRKPPEGRPSPPLVV